MIALLRTLSLPIGAVLLLTLIWYLDAIVRGDVTSSTSTIAGCLALVALYFFLSLPFWLIKDRDTSLVGLTLLSVAAALMSTAVSTTSGLDLHFHGEAIVPVVLWLTALLFHGEIRLRLIRELLIIPAALSALLAVFASGALCFAGYWQPIHTWLDLSLAILALSAISTFLVRELLDGLHRPGVFALYSGLLIVAALTIWQSVGGSGGFDWLIGISLVAGCGPLVVSFIASRRPPANPVSQEHRSEILVCYTCRCGKRSFVPISEVEPGWIDCCGGRSLELRFGRLRRKPLHRSSSRV